MILSGLVWWVSFAFDWLVVKGFGLIYMLLVVLSFVCFDVCWWCLCFGWVLSLVGWRFDFDLGLILRFCCL